MVKIRRVRCKKCQHLWVAEVENPTQCPNPECRVYKPLGITRTKEGK